MVNLTTHGKCLGCGEEFKQKWKGQQYCPFCWEQIGSLEISVKDTRGRQKGERHRTNPNWNPKGGHNMDIEDDYGEESEV